MKTVSIQIVTYNSANYIEACLTAVLNQSYPISSMVIIDNASTDDTKEILNRYKERKNFIIVYNEENVGFADGHNMAIRLTASDLCLVLNPDVELHSDYVLHLVDFINENPKAGSLTGKLVFKDDPNVIDSTGLIMTKSRRAFDRAMGEPSAEYNTKQEVFGVSGAAALYSRAMIQDISMGDSFFESSFFAYKEDVDVAWRAQLCGWKAFYIPEAWAYHARGWKKGNRRNIPLRIRQFSYINRYKMIIRNDNLYYILKHLPFILPFELLNMAYFIFREPRVLLVWYHFAKDFHILLAQRNTIQSKRKGSILSLYSFFQ
jgi:GT2 family glycosyltransferase